LVTVIKGHEDDVTAIAFNPKGKKFQQNFTIFCLLEKHSGQYLASFGRDKTLRLFSTSTLTEREVK